MKHISLIVAAVGMAAFTVQPSFAACDVTGSVNKDGRSGISKDGSLAPLESSSGSKTADTGAKPAQKNGEAMPLGENPNIAMSQQDVNAQQHGDKTAAAKAMQEKCD